MKILKRMETGLISFIDFSSGGLEAPFIDKSNSSLIANQLVINSGEVVFESYNYENLIMIVKNSYLPVSNNDFGGIAVTRYDEKRRHMEYLRDEVPNLVPYIKINKTNDIYHGFNSEDEVSWNDRDYVYFPEAESLSLEVLGNTPYPTDWIKVYKEDYIYIYSVLPGWKVQAYELGGSLITETITDNEIAKLQLPKYPYNCNFKVFDGSNTLIADYDLTDVWGGDEYIVTANVDLQEIDTSTSLLLEENRDFGTLSSFRIETKCKIVNLDQEDPITVTLRVAVYSPFYDWISIAKDNNGEPIEYLEELEFSLNPSESKYFWVLIQRPNQFTTIDGFDYKRDKCIFYLEVI